MRTDWIEEGVLTSDSEYDSGRHTGFSLLLKLDGFKRTEESADKFLTVDQIEAIEGVIVSLAKSFSMANNRRG